jgi:hypothetical protein
VKVGVADAAEKDFDLHVAVGQIRYPELGAGDLHEVFHQRS